MEIHNPRNTDIIKLDFGDEKIAKVMEALAKMMADSAKTKADAQIPVEESDVLLIRPLGGCHVVGRPCVLLKFKGEKIMLDCGIDTDLSVIDSLPYVDVVEPDEVNVLLISHFHLDHCGSLSWLFRENFL